MTARFFNRDLSWLEFNERVLDEARDESVPLLERLKFLAITASNLDEFFMVRVGGLQLLARGGSTKADPSGLTPVKQLAAISRRTQVMAADQQRCYLEHLEPALAEAGVRRLRPDDLTDHQARTLQTVFEDEIFPLLTPMAVVRGETFPLLANRTVNLLVHLEAEAEDAEPRFAIIPFGPSVSRFCTLPAEGGYDFVLVEDVVAAFAQKFFPGEPIVECVPFRITRNADLALGEDQASDLLSEMQNLLDARKESHCVRLEISDRVTSAALNFLQDTLDVGKADVFAQPGPLDFSASMRLTDLSGFDELKNEPWPPAQSPAIDPAESMFENIGRGDVLLYHPCESFEPVVRFIEEAAGDPDVLAIKQTLYRTSRNSPVVAALMRAAERGKSVAAIVELKARFDEERNIEWARAMEQAGVQVIYGVKGLKTHAKVCLVIRREPHGIVRYVHFGTGNYNEQTARLYTDVSLLTADVELAVDATAFFNAVTGYSQPQPFRRIAAAPLGLRDKLLELIDGEILRKQQKQRAGVRAKMNSLVDPVLIEKLYEASSAGVPIKLCVRGICCLRPGVKKLSETIEVISIIDRLLEHARIFEFHQGGDREMFISSADWMPRNLDRRAELMVPVADPACKRRLKQILDVQFDDTVKARTLLADGMYESRTRGRKRSQQILSERAREIEREAEQSRRTTFQPHRPE